MLQTLHLGWLNLGLTYFSLTWNSGTQFRSASTLLRIESCLALSRHGKLIEQISQILACQQTENFNELVWLRYEALRGNVNFCDVWYFYM